jgi:hypothetical protein
MKTRRHTHTALGGFEAPVDFRVGRPGRDGDVRGRAVDRPRPPGLPLLPGVGGGQSSNVAISLSSAVLGVQDSRTFGPSLGCRPAGSASLPLAAGARPARRGPRHQNPIARRRRSDRWSSRSHPRRLQRQRPMTTVPASSKAPIWLRLLGQPPLRPRRLPRGLRLPRRRPRGSQTRSHNSQQLPRSPLTRLRLRIPMARRWPAIPRQATEALRTRPRRLTRAPVPRMGTGMGTATEAEAAMRAATTPTPAAPTQAATATGTGMATPAGTTPTRAATIRTPAPAAPAQAAAAMGTATPAATARTRAATTPTPAAPTRRQRQRERRQSATTRTRRHNPNAGGANAGGNGNGNGAPKGPNKGH